MENFKRKIFILHEGGVFHNIEVSPDLKDIEVVLIDLDTEGLEPQELGRLNGREAYIRRGPADGIAKPTNYRIRTGFEPD